MADGILDDVTILIVVIIIGAVVCVIGYAVQSILIVGFGVILASSIPVMKLIIAVLESI